jgi:hypothetical protein
MSLMRLRDWIIGMCALVSGGAVQAQEANDHYATVGKWEIEADPRRKLCQMYRYYGSTKDDHLEGMIVRYDAAKESVGLTWSTNAPTLFPGDGEIDLLLSFFKEKSIDDSWGGQTFRHYKPEDTRYFASVFTGVKDSNRILRDLAVSELIGLYLGPTLMTALSLDAAGATETLRECTLKIAGQPSPDSLPK